jgi:hypothetical protein
MTVFGYAGTKNHVALEEAGCNQVFSTMNALAEFFGH